MIKKYFNLSQKCVFHIVVSSGRKESVSFRDNKAAVQTEVRLLPELTVFVPCCVPGFVSAVVFTGPTAEEKSPLAQHVQQLVRSANPTAAFIRAERGAVIR